MTEKNPYFAAVNRAIASAAVTSSTCPAKAMGGKTGDELRWSETWLCELPADPPHVDHRMGEFVWRFEA